MHIARPQGGFNIIISTTVRAYIDLEAKDNFRITQFWLDIIERLKFVAVREGRQLTNKGDYWFSYLARGSPDFGIPTIQLVYKCFSDTVNIEHALVWRQADYEDDEESQNGEGEM